METKKRDEIQAELYNLYDELSDDELINKIKGKNLQLSEKEKSTDPLFICVSEDYLNADIRLMIFGQETNGWGNEFITNNNIDEMLDLLINGDGDNPYYLGYKGFFSEKACYKLKTPFWKLVSEFIFDLQTANQEKKIDYIWNNVIKMGKSEIGFPNDWYNDIIKPYFNNLIIKEIDILKPDFIVFFSGYKYDKYLNDIFGILPKKSIIGFREKELCEIEIPNIKKAFRTYHPGFLNRNNQNRPYSDYFKAIIEEINKGNL